ncbi:MAG TPA: CoA transferase [Hyphomicrobiaceae bacterium]|jgi:crotonobetainyl-CoA:carnitine CoA-transferase CaiB-like acyl-CoA transferase|nr:CoA transferase [Hyphomicrobiaceae bacterium]
MSQEKLPLNGIRVVEFCHMIMGPSCGLILGDLGADVIKIEPVPNGDNTRRLVGSGAGFFPAFNRNKRSIALDLKSPEGLGIARKLIASADVLTENFRPGAMTKLGLGAEDASALNPRLIYCSLKGFLSGPYSHRAALDEIAQMMGGLAYMTGPPGRPLRAGASVIDMMGGMFAVIGIMAALREREKTGRGQPVTSALFENCAWVVAQHMLQYAITGQAARPMPERISAWGIYDVFDCKDGQLFIGVVTDTQWKIFCEAFGFDDMLRDQNLATNNQRCAARPELIPRLREIFKTWSKADLEAKVAAAGLPYAPITRPEQLYDDPHLRESGALLPITLPDGRKTEIPALPFELGGRRFGVWREIPGIGQQGPEILADIGLGREEITSLVERGIVGAPTGPAKTQAAE